MAGHSRHDCAAIVSTDGEPGITPSVPLQQNGKETQRNDIEVIRQITKTRETIPIQRAYDFRFAREADRQLTQLGWRP